MEHLAAAVDTVTAAAAPPFKEKSPVPAIMTADVDEQPVAEHLGDLHVPCEHGYGNETVAGEKLAAGNKNHGKPRREHAGTRQLCRPSACHESGNGVGPHGAQRNEHSGENAEKQELYRGHGSFGLSYADHVARYLSRCEHDDSSFFRQIVTII